MSREIQQDYLIVSARMDVPSEADMRKAITRAGLGNATYQAGGGVPPVGLVTRRRVGAFTVTGARMPARAEIIVFRYDDAMTHGMGEQTFQRLTRGLEGLDLVAMRDGTLVFDTRVSIPEAIEAQAPQWAFHLARVIAAASQGVVLDLAAQRCLTAVAMSKAPVERLETHVALHDEVWAADKRWLHTHGLQKYGRPEVDLLNVPTSLVREAKDVLRQVVSSLAQGFPLHSGQRVLVEGGSPLVAMSAPADMDHLAPHGRLMLVDVPYATMTEAESPRACLGSLALSEARRMLAQGGVANALESIERVISASPEDCAALTLKATLAMRAGNPLEALAQGELMKMRAPSDFRGPLACATALAALRRYPEALAEINLALRDEPESHECFALRAELYTHMGSAREAADDKNHAAYLRHFQAQEAV